MSRWTVALALIAAVATAPVAVAQEPPPAEEAAQDRGPRHGHRHGREDPPPDAAEEQAPQGSEKSHSAMDHSRMEHPAPVAGHTVERTAATASVAPYFESPEMDRARAAARREMGGGRFLMLRADRLEWRSGEGAAVGLLEGQGWYGGDGSRLWVKTDAELVLDAPAGAEALESAEVQALFSRPLSAFFDLQVGLRHDLEPSPSRTFAVVGLQGLAPQWFEVDVALFLSDDGDLSGRLEAEYDLLFTQRLVLQLRGELDLAASDVPEVGLGSGPSSVEAGVRLGYGRLFAPYVGVSWERKLRRTADLARAAGEEVGSLSAVLGVSFWY